MRLVLCILSIALLPAFAFAAKGTMSLTEARRRQRRRRCSRRHHDDDRPPDLFERVRQTRPQ